jgi:hypothetical protein
MKRFVEVRNGKSGSCFNWMLDTDPQYEEGSIEIIEITGQEDPICGSDFSDGIFTPPVIVPPTTEALTAAFDSQRDVKLEETDAEAMSKMLEALCVSKGVTVTDERGAAILAYRQALRDLPDQEGFDPENPVWPEEA